MIAINNLEKRTNVLLLVPYYAHATVRGFLDDVNRDSSRVVTYLFNEAPELDKQIKPQLDLEREYISPETEFRKDFVIPIQRERRYISRLKEVVDQEGIEVVVPTKERYVKMLARNKHLFRGKLFIPSTEVVDLLQSKANSYDFLKSHGILTPDYVRFSSSDLSPLEIQLRNHGQVFVKPARESGGKKAHKINSLEEFSNIYKGYKGELMACELLNLPEYNHTILIKNGQVQIHATYQCPGSTVKNPVRTIYKDPEIDKIAEGVCAALKIVYGSEQIDGVYNIDFLTNNLGNYVLNEVNVGRLPGGHSIFTEKGLNLSEALIKNTLVGEVTLSVA